MRIQFCTLRTFNIQSIRPDFIVISGNSDQLFAVSQLENFKHLGILLILSWFDCGPTR